MNIIKKKLIDCIKKNPEGISLEQFIEICLFDKNGYYRNEQPIGRNADFITSPEISQLFGEILGLYIYNFWLKNLHCKFNLIERETLFVRFYCTKNFFGFGTGDIYIYN